MVCVYIFGFFIICFLYMHSSQFAWFVCIFARSPSLPTVSQPSAIGLLYFMSCRHAFTSLGQALSVINSHNSIEQDCSQHSAFMFFLYVSFATPGLPHIYRSIASLFVFGSVLMFLPVLSLWFLSLYMGQCVSWSPLGVSRDIISCGFLTNLPLCVCFLAGNSSTLSFGRTATVIRHSIYFSTILFDMSAV